MPDNNIFLTVKLDDGRTEQWTPEQYEQSKDKLFDKYPKAQVLRTSVYDPQEGLDNADSFGISLGDGRTEMWSADQMQKGYDKLIAKYPEAQVSRVSNMSQQYWKPKEDEAKRRLDEFDALNRDFINDFDARRAKASSTISGTLSPEYKAFVDANGAKYDDLIRQREELRQDYFSNPLVMERYENNALGAADRRDEYEERARNAADRAERKDWQRAAKLEDDIRKMYEAPNKYDKEIDAGNGFAKYLQDYKQGAFDKFSDKDFYTIGLSSIARNFDLRGIAEKVQNAGSEADIDQILTESEKAQLNAFYNLAEAQMERADNIAGAYTAGQTAAESTKFMAEFLLSQGLANVAGKALSTSTNAVASWLGRQLMSSEALKQVATTASKTNALVDIGVKPIVQGLWHTGTQLSSLEAIAEGMMQTDSNGDLLSKGQVIGRELLDQVIENWSESLGGAVEGRLTPKFEGRTQFGRFARWLNESAPAKVLGEAGFNGLLGEIGEEWAGNAVRLGTGLMSKEEFKDFASWEQQLEMAASFAPMSLIGIGTTSAAAIRNARDYKDLSGKVADIMKRQNKEGEIENLLNTKYDTPEDIGKKLAPILTEISKKAQEEGATDEIKEDYKTMLDFAKVLGEQAVLDEQQRLEQEGNRNQIRDDIQGRVGRFWEEGDETVPEDQRHVRVVTDAEGNRIYVTASDEKGVTGVSVEDGKPRIVDAENIQEDTTLPMAEYLQQQSDLRDQDTERQRMEQETAEQIKAVMQRVQPNTTIPMGTESEPVNATVLATDNQGAVLTWQTADGKVMEEKKPWSEIASLIGSPITVKTDAELAQETAEAIDKANERAQTFNKVPAGTTMVVNLEEVGPVNLKFQKAVVDDGQVLVYGIDEEGNSQPYAESDIANLEEMLAAPVEEKAESNPYAAGEQITYIDEAGNTHKGKVAEADNGGGYTTVELENGATATVRTDRLALDTEVPRDSRGKAMPTRINKETGQTEVDSDALWQNDPQAWVEWNDSNPDSAVSSDKKLSFNINALNGRIEGNAAKIEDMELRGGHQDEVDALKEEQNKITGRRDQLQTLLDSRVAAVANAAAVEAPVQEAQPAAPQAPVAYEQGTPQATYSDIYGNEAFETAEEADGFVQGRIANATAEVQKAQKAYDKVQADNKAGKYASPAEFAQAKAQAQQSLAQAQSNLDHWNGVKAIADNVAAEARKAAEAEQMRMSRESEEITRELEAIEMPQDESMIQSFRDRLQALFARAKQAADKANILKKLYDAISGGERVVVLTRGNALEVAANEGFTPDALDKLKAELDRTAAIPTENTRAFAYKGKTFIVADDIVDIENGRTAFVHERQHKITDNKGYIASIMAYGIPREKWQKWVEKMSGSRAYEKDPTTSLMHEALSMAMEIAYSNEAEDLEQKLRDKGIDNEDFINFIKTIDNEQQNDPSLRLGRGTLRGRQHQVSNLSDEGSVRQNGGNQGSGAGEVAVPVDETGTTGGGRGEGIALSRTGQAEGIGDNEQRNDRHLRNARRSLYGADGQERRGQEDGRDSQPISAGDIQREGSRPGENGPQGAGGGQGAVLSRNGQEPGTIADNAFHKEGDELTSFIDNPTGQKDASAPAEVLFSLTREGDLRTQADNFLAQAGNKPLTAEELSVGSDAIGEMVDYMLPYLDKVKEGKRYLPEEIFGKGWTTIFKNGSYGRTMENTLICMRTLAYNDFVNAVQEKIGRPLTPTESFLASQMLYDIATDPQCLYCYVALDRKAYNGFLKTYIEQRDAVLDKYKTDDGIDKAYRLPEQAKSRKTRKKLPADNQVNALYLEYLNGRADTPAMRNRFNGWLDRVADNTLIGMKDLTSPETMQKVAGKGAEYASQIDDAHRYAQSASWAKKQEEYRAYNGELLSMPQNVVDLLNSEYGLRFYSFSEYSPAFIVENMQMVRDAALRNLVGLAYTKEIDFAKIFAPTGININISVYGREAEDGTIVMDTKQGADWNEAQAMRDKYGNVGCVFVATNDRMAEWALQQPWIDVVIPFHIVRTGEDIAKFYNWTNYTSMEADKDKKGRAKDIMPTEHMNDKETFLRLCEERGLKPRFADLILPSTGKSVVEDPNYMKLVNETRRSVAETTRIKPTFDVEEARKSFDAFVEKGGYYAGWYNEEGAFEKGVEQVAADVEAGKTAMDVDYGRQDIRTSAAKLAELATKRTRPRTHQGTPRRVGEDVQFSRSAEPQAVDKVNAYINGTNAEDEMERRQTEELFAKAKERFGTTEDIREAGYVLPDGSMLDFSGRHWMEPGSDTSYLAGDRQVDHRDIADLAYERDGNTPTGVETSMSDFIDRGAIRIHNGSGAAINLAQKPTAAQQARLRRLIDMNNGDVWVDFGNGDRSDHYVEYGAAKSARVLNDINRYFDEGYKPEGTLRFSRRGEREQATTEGEVLAENLRFSRVTDPKLLEELDKGKTFKAYRAMALIDGKLYSPMATQLRDEKGRWALRQPTELGVWEQSDEHPEKAVEKNGKWVYRLKKPDGSTVDAAYNPYIHTSLIPLNDQFTAAHKRPELVTVEVEVPEGELTSGYKAEKAKNAVGKMTWHSGPVAGQLPEGSKREVVLSRYDKPVRIVPDSEVADKIVEAFKGVETEPFPWNVFTPSLREELRKRGVQFSTEAAGTVSKKDQEAEESLRYSKENNSNFTDNYGKESEQNQTRDGQDSRRVSQNSARRVPISRDRSDIRVLEPQVATDRREYSDDNEGHYQREIEESSRLIAAAKANGLFIPEEQLSTFGVHIPSNTMESEIYYDVDNNRYIKSKNPFVSMRMMNGSPEEVIYQHLLHNIFFPETRYDFLGISEHNGEVRIILSQEGVKSYRDATLEEAETYLTDPKNGRGYTKRGKYSYENDEIIVRDLEGQNLLIGDDGAYYPIDPIIGNKIPAREILEKHIKEEENPKLSFSKVYHGTDAEYLAAVKAGDMEKAQRMVDEKYEKYLQSHKYSQEDVASLFENIIDHFKDDFGSFGIRYDTRLLTPESIFPHSHQLFQDYMEDENGEQLYPDGEGYYLGFYDAGELEGTSTLFVQTKEDILKALRLKYDGRYVYLVAGNFAGEGYDPGEALMDDARVLSVMSIPEIEHNSKYHFNSIYHNVFTNKSADPVTYDDNGNVIPLSERFNEKNDDIRFSRANQTQNGFISNAEASLDKIKMDKATPEQWLKMLEKEGGLKAGEDKWIGLSDWIKESGKKSLTKQEIADYIAENRIQIEEVNYAEDIDMEAETQRDIQETIGRGKSLEELQEEIDELKDSAARFDFIGENPSEEDMDEFLTDAMVEDYGDDFKIGYVIEDGYIDYNIDPYSIEEDEFNRSTSGTRKIDSTRLGYTTKGLDNKREIALTVPTIESWNERDQIHFGDAGEGRAVAWARFGDTTAEKGEKVLFIDEIQSKRHQEGREKGYKDPALEKEYKDLLTKEHALIIAVQERRRANENEYGPQFRWPDDVADRYRALEEDRSKALEDLRRFTTEHNSVSGSIPAAPFEKNWHELAMKRMLRLAAEEGYDYVAWTTGDQQAERYDLGSVISGIDVRNDIHEGKIVYLRHTDGNQTDLVVDENGKIIDVQSRLQIEEGASLGDIVGKDLAAKIMAYDGEETMKIEGDGLRIGGGGMNGFYDDILPRFMNKYGKKWGVKTEDMQLPNLADGITAHAIPVTQEMKESVMEGQLMFSRAAQAVEQADEGGIQAVVGSDNAKDFASDIYRAMPAEMRRVAVDRAMGGDLNIHKALVDDLSRIAYEGYENDEAGILRAAGKVLSYYAGENLDEATVRYILWRNGQPNDLLTDAQAAALKRRWGVGEDLRFSRDEMKESVDAADNAAEATVDEAAKALSDGKRDLKDMLTATRAMRLQKEYDKKTIEAVTNLAKQLLKDQYVSEMSRRDIARLLGLVRTSAGRSPRIVKRNADTIVEIVIDNLLKKEKAAYEAMTKKTGTKTNATGVEVQGELDIQGQKTLKAYKEGLKLKVGNVDDSDNENTLYGMKAKVQSRLGSRDDAVRAEAEAEDAGLTMAIEYQEGIAELLGEEKGLEAALDDLKAALAEGEITKKAYDEAVESTNDAIRANHIDQVEAYRDFATKMRAMLSQSREDRAAFVQEEKDRVNEIHHLANSDMQGKSASRDKRPTFADKLANNPIARFAMAPLATFDQMLRLFGEKSINGEGYLWNKFMSQWQKATENEYTGQRDAKEKLDKKVSEVFGKKMIWSDLYDIELKMPKVTARWWDDGAMRDHELTQGQLLYIYMVNKMADGRMKLRRMGIEQEHVDAIVRQMDERFLALADWLQEEFLVDLRNKYNAVHERLFGASMAAIDDYFPLVINKRDLERNEDVGLDTDFDSLPSTTTGSIIKRKRNNKALDLMNADAFSVVIDHIDQMEKWAAFAEFNKDVNALLSYKRFRNQVQNMASVYGSGTKLWDSFKSVAKIAAGSYKPKRSNLDKDLVNIAKGVTAAKISFRVYTALKQTLSSPAFLADASMPNLAKSLATAGKSWVWAMENLPIFEKRWKSRIAGDTRLMQTDLDWNFYRKKLYDKASKLGMSPNAFVDAVTVAVGAKAIYDTKYAQFKSEGFSDEDADRKAKTAATVLVNETQQSSEGAFVSPVQLDRTVLATMITVFRNSSMGFQRQVHDSLRNLGKHLKAGYKEQSLEYTKKQLMRDGLTEEQAEQAAKKRYNKSFVRDATRLAVFGFLVEFSWNLGSYIVYLLFGDDDDKKKEMLADAARHAMFGGLIEGLAGGNVVSEGLNTVAQGKSLWNYDPQLLPLFADIKSAYSKMSSDPVAGWNDVVNLAVQAGIGVNPQTLTDAVVAVADACDGDLETSKEAMLLIMRVLQVPQSQVDELYIDELGTTARKAQKMSYSQMAQRYADYKIAREAPLTGWAYSDEARKKREKSKKTTFKKKVNERKK